MNRGIKKKQRAMGEEGGGKGIFILLLSCRIKRLHIALAEGDLCRGLSFAMIRRGLHWGLLLLLGSVKQTIMSKVSKAGTIKGVRGERGMNCELLCSPLA